jgi:hypothetical protein
MFWKSFNSIIAPLCILIPIIAGLIKFKALSFNIKLIWCYLVLAALINTAATIVARVYHLNNLPLVHLFTLVEGLMLISFYKYTLDSNEKKRWYISLQIAFLVICIINAIFFQSIYTYSSYTRYAESLICMLFALNYFAKIAALELKPLTLPTFYINSGIFLYFSGSFILFIFSNMITYKVSLTNFLIIWNIHASLFVLMYLFFTIGFIKCKK